MGAKKRLIGPDDRGEPDPQSEALGRAVKVLRTDQGIDRGELAEMSGLSYPYVSEIENGKKRPSSRALEALASSLGVRAHELLAAADARVEPSMDASVSSARLLPTDDRSSWFGSEPRGPSSPGRPVPRSLHGALAELERLLPQLGADDVERVLDLARRLAR